MAYPDVFRGGWFFDDCSQEKNRMAAWGSGGEAPENFGYLAFCGAQNIVFMAVCGDKQ